GGLVRVWDAETGRQLAQLAGHAGAVTGVAVSADGRHALSGGEDGSARLWDLSALPAPVKPRPVVVGPSPPAADGSRILKNGEIIRTVQFAPDGRYFAT